jgi:hypothetical protein
VQCSGLFGFIGWERPSNPANSNPNPHGAKRITVNPMENPAKTDWLWILWAVLYSVGFVFSASVAAIPNAWVAYSVGLMALAALKYLIRFNG